MTPWAALGLTSLLLLAPGRAMAQYTASSWARSDVNTATSYSSNVGSAKELSSSLGAVLSTQSHAANVDNVLRSLTSEDWSSANASATPGALHLSAQTDATSKSTQVCAGCLGGANAVAHAAASASFSDVVALGFTGLAPRTNVIATFAIHVDGNLLAHATGNLHGQQVAQVNWTFWLNGVHYDANGGYGYRVWIDEGHLVDSAVMPDTVVMKSVLTLGQGFGISMAANVSSQAVASSGVNGLAPGQFDEGSGHGTAGFANTFAWGGLIGLTDLNGNPLDLSLARATSASGFDYTQAYVGSVPEPSPTALLVTGLLLLPGLRARRRRV